MTLEHIIIATICWCLLTSLVYWKTGWNNIKECYQIWFKKTYWTNYNIIDGLSWLAKAIIIVPGLIFGIQVWWLYFVPLITSMALIWASERKLLPTMVGFNTLWVWISCMVLSKHIF
ncbi:hypothetical protein EBR43_10255 [bacterium]|nr:hypothetical protein [bacterium]